MKPERWQQIEQLYHAALERAVSERPAFLDAACARGFPAAGAKGHVSTKGGDWVRWRKDSQEIFYVAPDRQLMSVAVTAVSGSLEFGTPSPLARAPTADAEEPSMTIILNWQADLSAAKK